MPHTDRTVQGRQLRRLRRDRIGSQATLADALGVRREAVARWETGTHQPAPDTLLAIARLLDVDLDAFTVPVGGELALTG